MAHKIKKVGNADRDYYVNNYHLLFGGDSPLAEQYIQETVDILQNQVLTDMHRARITTNMKYLAEFYACKGNMLCFQGQLFEGWKQMKRGFYYAYWNFRMSLRFYDIAVEREKNKGNSHIDFHKKDIGDIGKYLGTSFILAPEESDFIFKEIESNIPFHSFYWRPDDCYIEYLLHLYQILNNHPLSAALPVLDKKIYRVPIKWEHPYDNIFKYWNEDVDLCSAVLQMLNYHKKWNLDYTPEHYSEFHSHFSMINPVDFQAFEYVRRQLGLSVPKIEHEFLNEPFYPIPDGIREIPQEDILAEDDLLREIVHRNIDWCLLSLSRCFE